MKNKYLTASYIKDLLNFMKFYQLNAVTIKGKYKLYLLNGKYILDDLEYNRELPQENITANSKEEFILKLKESEFYKTEL